MSESAKEPTTPSQIAMVLDVDVPIRLRDGATVFANVYRPEGDGVFPVLATYGPYGKDVLFRDAYRRQWQDMVDNHPDAFAHAGDHAAWEVPDPEHWIPLGYALVRVDSRGAGQSPGRLDPWSQQEARDFYDVIEWAGEQPWSNGRVGLSGVSYFAKNQWQVAALHPPHLRAICPWEGNNDFYREMTYHGGVHTTFLAWWYPRLKGLQHGFGSRGYRNPITGRLAAGSADLSEEELFRNRVDLEAEILRHPFIDDWHRERSSDASAIEVPVLSAANWGGLGNHSRGNFESWLATGGDEKWLEVHTGAHWEHYYTLGGLELQRRFFDYFLKGVGDWPEQPRVLLNVRDVEGAGHPRAEEEWPLARTAWTDIYLDAADASLRVGPPKDVASTSFDASGEGVTFVMSPSEAEVEVTGPLSARIWISSSTKDADVFLVLRAFAPDGSEVLFRGANDPKTPLSQGWLRLSHRSLDETASTPWRPVHRHDGSDWLTPGEPYEVEVELWPTSIVLPAGYRLALTVRGSDFDHGLEPSPIGERGSGVFMHDDLRARPTDVYDNTITIHTGGKMPSTLRIPVIPHAGDDA